MGVPQVAIVGRPNVGKSSLLNWLAGVRVAIVDDRPGVTRDRLVHLMEHDERFFELVDTGGMGHIDADRLTEHIEGQISQAIDSADVILFLVDTREGVLPLDQEVTKRLRYLKTPIICLANKTDDESFDSATEEFYRLGFGRPLKVSTLQNRNRAVLLNKIVQALPPPDAEDSTPDAEPEMRVAIVGRRNVGKSTFVNTLVNAERVIVSEVPGTTRDSVDVRFELDGKGFVAIDTPGIRRRQGRKDDIDFYGTHRAERSIRRSDVVLLFLDCGERISKVDKQLAEYIVNEYRPCILVVNKWDQLAGTMPTEKWVHYLNDQFPAMRYSPIAFITGQTGKNVKALLNHAQMLFKQSRQRVSTGRLNRLVRDALRDNPPPVHENRRPRIYYATQVGTQPPTVVLFCSKPSALSKPYQRYLLGRFRDEFEFAEVPIKLYLRKRESNDPRNEIDAQLSSGEQRRDVS